MDFLKLFIAALMPVLKVLLITCVGTFLALDRFDILRQHARKHLNTMAFFVFAPAFVYSILSKSLTFKSLAMLWFMPLNVLLALIIGTALGWLLIKITEVPQDLHGLVLGCCAAGNLGNLPLIIVPAVCKEGGTLFGAADVCHQNGLAFTSLSMALGTFYLWSYVYHIVRMSLSKISNGNKAEDSNENSLPTLPAQDTDVEAASKCSDEPLDTAENKSQTNDDVHHLEIETTVPDRKAKVAAVTKQLKLLAEKLHLQEAIISPSTVGANYDICRECHLSEKFYITLRVQGEILISEAEKKKQESERITKSGTHVAKIIGIIIGGVSPFRKALIGDNAPLRVLQDSASVLGDACIPTVTLLVGANLLQGLKGKSLRIPLIVGILVVKFIVLPVFGVAIVKGAVRFGLIHRDPLYQFVLLLQFSLPPPVAISTMTQLFGVGQTECSVIMLATYACATVCLTLWCAFFMWLVQ